MAYYFRGNFINFFLLKNYCPYCQDLLSKKMLHKIVNSQSDEAARGYKDFFDGSIGNFNRDICHHVFFCKKCNAEIEATTLFTFEKAQKALAEVSLIAKEKNLSLEIIYLNDYGKTLETINLEVLSRVIIKLLKDGDIIEEICCVAQFYSIYEEARYFKLTKGYQKIKKLLRKIDSNT